MSSETLLDREEYIEQAYLFRVMRDRLGSNFAAQEILDHVHEEILSTTRLPFAIQFLATELKHSGLLSSGFARLPHYFAPFQTFVARQAEEERHKFTMQTALLVLEREAQYRAGKPDAPPTRPGLFVYQFEALCRNRLGYDEGLSSIAADPFYDDAWRGHIDLIRRQLGAVDFADLIYLRSELYVRDQRKQNADYEPPLPPLFGEKEGKIAKANRGRDPLYLFAALQRQLGYPEVPRPIVPDDLEAKLKTLIQKLNLLETRLKLVEGELKGQVDLSQFGKPELLSDLPKDEN